MKVKKEQRTVITVKLTASEALAISRYIAEFSSYRVESESVLPPEDFRRVVEFGKAINPATKEPSK